MIGKQPYEIIKKRLITEKSEMLGRLKSASGNPSLARCQKPKYVFIVDPSANKREIAEAVEEIYKEQNIKVESVNTIRVKSKPGRQLRRRRGRGEKPSFKKAIVTLAVGDSIEAV